MDRRRFLAGLVLLAGCSSPERPSRFETFLGALRERDVAVKRAAADFRRWTLEYYPDRGTEAFREEMAAIAAAYAESVPPEREKGNHRYLECILFDADKRRTGSYLVRAEWARRHAEGTLPAGEYLELVRGTLVR